MNAQVTFNGFQGLDHHHFFVGDMAEKIVGQFERHKEFNIQVLCRKLHTRHSPKHTQFECEILLYADPLRGDLFVRKSGDTFYSAVRSAFHAIEKILRRESKTRISRWRRVPAPPSLPTPA